MVVVEEITIAKIISFALLPGVEEGLHWQDDMTILYPIPLANNEV